MSNGTEPAVAMGNCTLGGYDSAERSARLTQRLTIEQIVEYIRSDNLDAAKAELLALQAVRGECGEECRPAAGKRRARHTNACRDPKVYKARNFPAVTLSGVIEGERAKGWPVRHTGLYQVDIDIKEGANAAAELRDRAGLIPQVVLAYVSPSNGVKVWARGTAPVRQTKEAQVAEWEYANRQVCQALGLDFDARAADPMVKSVAGLCFMAPDPDARYNPDAEAFPAAPLPEPSVKPKPAAGSGGGGDKERAAQAALHLQTSLPPAGSNTRGDWLAVGARVANIWDEAHMLAWIEGSARPDDSIPNWRDIVGSETPEASIDVLIGVAVNRYGFVGKATDPVSQAYDRRKAARGEAAAGGQWSMGSGKFPKPVAGSTNNAVIALTELGRGEDWQWNEWRQIIVWRATGRDFNDKVDLGKLRLEAERRYAGGLDYVPTAEALYEGVRVLALDHPFNPVVDAIRAVEWDGVDRLSDFGTRVYRLAADDAAGNASARLIAEGCVVRGLEPGSHFPYIPIVVSVAQGTGKGDSLRFVSPGQYLEGIQFTGFDYQRKMQERGRGASIIERGEIHAVAGQELDQMKAFATDNLTRNREAYAREAADLPLSFICVGTTNRTQFLTDTDHRRFPVIRVPDGENVDLDWLLANRSQVWAQVAARYDAGVYREASGETAVRMDEDLWRVANENSKKYEITSKLAVWLEQAADEVERRCVYDGLPRGMEDSAVLPAYELQALMHNGVRAESEQGEKGPAGGEWLLIPYRDRYSNQELSREMQRLGWKSDRVRVGGSRIRCWVYEGLRDDDVPAPEPQPEPEPEPEPPPHCPACGEVLPDDDDETLRIHWEVLHATRPQAELPEPQPEPAQHEKEVDIEDSAPCTECRQALPRQGGGAYYHYQAQHQFSPMAFSRLGWPPEP